jgi:ribosomal-protein-alanine N-acetyltransferase
MEVATKRLLLREFTDADLAEMAAYQADSGYREFREKGQAEHRSLELLGLFRRWADERPRFNYQLAIARVENPETLIGNCGVRGKGLDPGTAEFGIELATRWWGNGYATEAASAILAFGFREIGLGQVQAVSVTENARVTRLLERLGFAVLSRCSGSAWMRSQGWTETRWQLAREQWQARQKADV